MASVFVYEPDAAMRDLLTLQLAHLGHRVAEAGDDYTIALVEPASREGLRAAREVRTRAPGIPLVLVSVLPSSPETIELGATAHLLKPVLLQDLRAALTRCAADAR